MIQWYSAKISIKATACIHVWFYLFISIRLHNYYINMLNFKYIWITFMYQVNNCCKQLLFKFFKYVILKSASVDVQNFIEQDFNSSKIVALIFYIYFQHLLLQLYLMYKPHHVCCFNTSKKTADWFHHQ